MKIGDVINFLETEASLTLQESYDNAGLIVGNKKDALKGVLICLDSIEATVDEAIEKNVNLIVAHHPIIFKGLKSITGKNYVEKTILKAIKNDIAIYAIHTNLDNVLQGVNYKIMEKIGIENSSILKPMQGQLLKLICFVPEKYSEKVKSALFESGAGKIGNYSEASFSSIGVGTFKGNAESKPRIGKQHERTTVKEQKVEVILNEENKNKVLGALLQSHPYEEVAYDLIRLENKNKTIGAGRIGFLKEAKETNLFLKELKSIFNCKVIRHTSITKQKIKKIAVCGGSGSFLLKDAMQQNADIFITADFKYHEFFDAENKIIIADIGHFESEQFTIELLLEKLSKKFSNFAIYATNINTNPVHYYI